MGDGKCVGQGRRFAAGVGYGQGVGAGDQAPGHGGGQPLGAGPGHVLERRIAQGSQLEFGQPTLAGPKKVARSTQFQVFFRQLKAVVGFFDRAQPFLAHVGRHIGEQNAVRLRRSPAHATSELVELRKAKTVRSLDHHHGRIRHVDPDLDQVIQDFVCKFFMKSALVPIGPAV